MLNPYKKNLIGKKTFTETPKPVRPILELYEKLGSRDSHVKRINRGVMICCPFHSENNPSCALYEDTNSFYCFTCKESGDYITFTEKLMGVDFKEALSIIERL